MKKRKTLYGSTCFQVTGVSKADDSDQLEKKNLNKQLQMRIGNWF